MDERLQSEIQHIIVSALEKKIDEYDLSKKSGNPFVDVIFGDLSSLKSFIHSSATRMGSTYEKIARKIAESNSQFVKVKKFPFKGYISADEKAVIKDIVKDLEENKRGSVYLKEVTSIYNAKNSNIKPTRITIDLYLKDKKGKEYYIEMKGPDPNKKEVRGAKEDLLNVIAMKKRNIPLDEFDSKVSVLFGVYYNNLNEEYKNWKVSPIFERGKGLLVQKEFWDFLGGKGTYLELMQVIEDVRETIYPKIKEKIRPIIDNL
jgi:type II restriction enzyme